ncbi:hypothetical protein [Flavobacterium lindanitolerans]|jgi:hypothetical protein|uniref:hypothetical protein n=1 Tax=Flavobacterium lindanitolerans TaxID=428988 RepID=UPI0023F0DB73|nr:hypothetical protein [Flavobacterium lindanitolerans]
MGFSRNHIVFDKDNNYLETKTYIWSNEKEFKTDVFRAVVERSSTFTFDDTSALQKEVDGLEFREDTDYVVLGLPFTIKINLP